VIHLLGESDPLIPNTIAELNTAFLLPLPLWLVLQQRSNALRINY
jgi:hypothetical protein